MSTPDPFRIVARMEGLRPENIARYEMHRLRSGGDVGHVDAQRSGLNRLLVGDEEWAARTIERVDGIRAANHARLLLSLERRKRKKDLLKAVCDGPADPWRPTQHGPMREMILTAHHAFFGADGAADLTEREQAFEQTAVDWLHSTFGNALVHARCDRDETAYHIHAILMPLVEKPDGRVMLEPSSHPLIARYEDLQDEVGRVFAPLGLARGERRAAAARDATAQLGAGEDVVVPLPVRHTPPRAWREEQARRLQTEAEAVAQSRADVAQVEARQQAAEVRLQRKAEETAAREAAQARDRAALAQDAAAQHHARAQLAAQAARQQLSADDLRVKETAVQARADKVARHDRSLREQSRTLERQRAEQDAFAAASEAVASGLLDPDSAAAPAPRSDVDRALLDRMARAPKGADRLMATLRPALVRLRQAAAGELSRERREVEAVWTKIRDALTALDPASATAPIRDAVDRVVARWRAMRARGPGGLPKRPEGRD